MTATDDSFHVSGYFCSGVSGRRHLQPHLVSFVEQPATTHSTEQTAFQAAKNTFKLMTLCLCYEQFVSFVTLDILSSSVIGQPTI